MLKNFFISNNSSCIKGTRGYRGCVYDMIVISNNEITFYNSDIYEKFCVNFQGSTNLVLFEKTLEIEDFYI